MLDRVRLDVRHALRRMRNAPALTAVATLVLALGIGTNTAVFAVIDGVLFRPPPGVRDAGSLVTITSAPFGASPGRPFVDALTLPEFHAVREAGGLEAAAWTTLSSGVSLRTAAGEERIRVELMAGPYFQVLRTPLELGTPLPPDAGPGTPLQLAVIGYGFWQARMGGAADVVGRTLVLNGQPFTIAGVAAEDFHGAAGHEDPIDAWLPATAAALLFPDRPELLRDERQFSVIARLAPGSTRERAGALVEAARLRMPPLAVDAEPRRFVVTPYRGLGSEDAGEILAVVGGVGGVIGAIVLLIACVNVGALLLGRAVTRRREIAVRLSLGASRGTLVRQLLTESVLLGLLAGAAGILITTWALDVLGSRLFTFPVELSPRPVTLAAAIALAAGTGILFGTVPALHATRVAVFAALKDAAAGADPHASRLRGRFAIAQLALCLPLVTAAGTLVSEVIGSATVTSSLREPERLVAIAFDLAPAGWSAEQARTRLDDARRRIAALPGIEGAAFARLHPVSTTPTGFFLEPGEDLTPGVPRQLVSVNAVDPEFFDVTGIRAQRGRVIGRQDLPGSVPVAVVEEATARVLWPGQDPIGRRVTYGPRPDRSIELTVVGVVRGPASAPGSDGLSFYAARAQQPDTLAATLIARTRGEPGAAIATIRAELNRFEPRLVTLSAGTVEELRRQHDTELAHASAGASGVGLVALFLACIGVYAVVAFGVAERTREIGVRVALGATRGQVVRLFVRGGLRMALISLAFGVPLTLATIRLLGAGMFGLDSFTVLHAAGLAGVATMLIGVALLSSWIPAWHGANVDPVQALRAE